MPHEVRRAEPASTRKIWARWKSGMGKGMSEEVSKERGQSTSLRWEGW